MATYIVRKGDTLVAIARKCCGSSSKHSEIATLNQLMFPSTLHEGQTLLLPSLKSSTAKSIDSGYDVYYVRYGDTLWKIADKMLGNPKLWSVVAKMNELSNPDFLLIGQPLKLPRKRFTTKEQTLKKEQQPVKPQSDPIQYNQTPAVAIPGQSHIYVVADEINPFRPKLVRKDSPGLKGFEPKNPNSGVTPGRHVMGDNKSKFTSTSEAPFGAARFRGVRYWIDVNILKNDGVKFYTREQIEADFKRIEAKYHDVPKTLEKVSKGRVDMALDKEVLIEGPIKPGAVKTALPMALTRGAQVFQGIGIILTAYSLEQAVEESYQEKSIKPVGKESIRQVGGWGGAVAGSWGATWLGMRAGALMGSAVTVETGPGVIIGGIVGALVGGFVGYKTGDWVAGHIDEKQEEPLLNLH